MENDKDIAALLSWGFADPLPQEGLARVAAHPRAADASRALARNMLETPVDALFKDGGHYVAAAWAAYLHGSGDLTLPRLKEAGVASGLLSTGRTRDLLAYLLHLGFIERIEEAASGTPARYALTDTFSAIWRDHLSAALRAACLVEPAAALILERLEQPDVFAAFARTQSGGLLEAATQLVPDHGYVRIFLHRRAGNQVIWVLVADGAGDFPAREPVAVSIAALARRFHVSRVHIRRMLDDAEREGLVSLSRGMVTLEDPVCEFLRWHYVGQILMLLIAAARAATLLAERGTPIG